MLLIESLRCQIRDVVLENTTSLKRFRTATPEGSSNPNNPRKMPRFCRDVVFRNPTFLKYFRTATPEGELGKLNIGSRPTRRKASDAGVGSLRAIPWIFAWTQTRHILPSWLGVGEALEQVRHTSGRVCWLLRCCPGPYWGVFLGCVPGMWHAPRPSGYLCSLPLLTVALLMFGQVLPSIAFQVVSINYQFQKRLDCLQMLPSKGKELQSMMREWPFFSSTLSLIEMTLAKADMAIASAYDDVLVTDPEVCSSSLCCASLVSEHVVLGFCNESSQPTRPARKLPRVCS